MLSDSTIRVRLRPRRWPWAAALWVCIAGPPSSATAGPSEIGHAERLHAQGLNDSAQVILDSLLVSDSADATTWMLQSRVQAARGEQAARLNALRRVQSAMPQYPDLSLQLTEAFLEADMIDSAAIYLEKLPLRNGRTEPFTMFLHAWLLQAQGRHDSAIAVYRRTVRAKQARTLVGLPVGVGARLSAITLLANDRKPVQVLPGKPTVFLFWRTGWDASETALHDIAVESPKAGIKWRFVPVHVGSNSIAPEQDVDPTPRARELEYKGIVWLDPDLRLFQDLGLTRVPTIIFTGLDGEIDQVLQDWSESTRDHVIEERFGNYTDTVRAPRPAPDQETLRPGRVLAQAQTTWSAGHKRNAVKALGTSLLKHPYHILTLVQLADWRWQQGDTLGARMAAHQALALDSLNTWSLLITAEIERRHQKTTLAIDLLRRCVSIDPEFARAWISLGVEATLSGDKGLARETLERVQNLDPFDRRLSILTAGLTDGDSEVRAASWHRAIRDLLR